MYNVKVVAVNEVMEVKVDAKYCVVDDSNNLVFVNKLGALVRPVAMFPAGRWIAVKQK